MPAILAYRNLAAHSLSSISATPASTGYPASRLGNNRAWERLHLTAPAGRIDITLPSAGLGITCAAALHTSLIAGAVVTAVAYPAAARTAGSETFSQALTDRGDGRLWWATFAARDERYWSLSIAPAVVGEDAGLYFVDDGDAAGLARVGEVFLGTHVELGRGWSAGQLGRTHQHRTGGQQSAWGAGERYSLGGPAETWQVGIAAPDAATQAQVIAAKDYCQGSALPLLMAPDSAGEHAVWCRGADDLGRQHLFLDRYALTWSLTEEPFPGDGVDW